MLKFSLNFVLVAISIGLVGCATAKSIKGPDGTDHQLVTCESIGQCYNKASEVCDGPYKIVNTTSETSGIYGTTSTEINLLIKCGR
jgi:hypothetical protein